LVAFGAGAHSTAVERTALGAGAGAYFALSSFRFELSAAVLAPIEVTLEPRPDVRGRVQLMRVPLSLSAGFLMSAGAFQLGPTLGFVLDVLHIEGQGVTRPQSELRLSSGLLLAADLHLWVSERVGLWVRPQMQMFPKAYKLVVDPQGALGETPQLWIGAQLGVQARLW
jgi:hypothetical protein